MCRAKTEKIRERDRGCSVAMPCFLSAIHIPDSPLADARQGGAAVVVEPPSRIEGRRGVPAICAAVASRSPAAPAFSWPRPLSGPSTSSRRPKDLLDQAADALSRFESYLHALFDAMKLRDFAATLLVVGASLLPTTLAGGVLAVDYGTGASTPAIYCSIHHQIAS